MADAYGKLTGRPGICFVTRGPGRDARVGRRAHRVPGLDAADPARRPGRLRPGGARGVPGDRLPAHVRADGEVGRADRPRRPHPRVRRARVHDRVRRAARAGRARAAGGHARDRDRRRRTREPFHVVQPHPGAGADRAPARPARARRAAVRDRSAAPAGRREPRARHARRSSRRTRCRPAPRSAARTRSTTTRRATSATSASASTRSSPRASARPTCCSSSAPRLGEMTTSGYTLLESPTPRRRSCTCIPAPRSSAASTGRSCRSSRAWSSSRAAVRDAARRRRAGASGPRRRAPTTRRGSSPSRCPARSTSASASRTLRERVPGRDRHERRRQLPVVGAPLLALPRAIRTQLAPTSGAMGYGVPAAVAAKLVAPGAHGRLLRRRRRLPDERPGARDRGAVRAADRRPRRRTTACTGRSACTRSATIPGASSAPTSSTPTSPPTRAPSARTARRSTETAEFADALERALDAGGRRCSSCASTRGDHTRARRCSKIRASGAAMSRREEIRVPGLAEPISHYTDAVRAGDLLFVSGCRARRRRRAASSAATTSSRRRGRCSRTSPPCSRPPARRSPTSSR